MKYRRSQTPGEEVANSITHGIGAVLSIAGSIVLIIFGVRNKDIWQIVSFSVFGVTLIFMYLMSTLYHGVKHKRAKRVLHALDHSSIYLLIAGTYTPVMLIGMRNVWGWTILGIVWTIAVTGIVLKIISLRKRDATSFVEVLIYIAMGWLVIIAVKPVIQSISIGTLMWIALGGLYYTIGTVFYIWNKLPYHHLHWHLFILAGSFTHFLAMFGI
jgi:hemolysin III